MFPIINHINDVLPAIEGRPEFIVGKRDGYQFIDYNYTQSDSFDCPIRRECRGLKFDLEGSLIARPLHKFFNLHEKPNEVPDFTQDHVIMEKLDGSMIHAAMVNGELVFMTRAGITDQARQAYLAWGDLPYGPSLFRFCETVLGNGYTPIFEYTAPSNQIVVKYAETNITLLAVRGQHSGQYLQQKVLEEMAKMWGIPAVRTFDQSARDLDAFVAHTKGLENMEGYVVRVGQQFVKLKADAYVAAHRAKSGLLFEKDVLRLVLENKIDDVLGVLTKDEANALKLWGNRVLATINMLRHTTEMNVKATQHYSQKDFADWVNDEQTPPYMKPILFSVRRGVSGWDAAVNYALKQTTSQAKAREFLDARGVPEWKPLMFAKLAEA